MRRSIVPSDSHLHKWLTRLSITEVPLSYQIVCGLSVLGCLLKRQIYIDGEEFRVYPNLSAMLIGPSGIGKDTIINISKDLISAIDKDLIVEGTTIEAIKYQMLDLLDPAAAFVPAPEMAAFFGGKDYQKSMVQDITDLLSTNDSLSYTTKTDGRRYILRPTVTLIAGSTASWLQELPRGALAGGFIPRFCVVCATHVGQTISWPKYRLPMEDLRAARAARVRWVEWLRQTVETIRARPELEITPTEDAMDVFATWDQTRHQRFPTRAGDYAHRARGTVHKLAMLMAITRGHMFLEDTDYKFALAMIDDVIKGIEHVLLPAIQASKYRH